MSPLSDRSTPSATGEPTAERTQDDYMYVPIDEYNRLVEQAEARAGRAEPLDDALEALRLIAFLDPRAFPRPTQEMQRIANEAYARLRASASTDEGDR
jgi:hypothetical protein